MNREMRKVISDQHPDDDFKDKIRTNSSAFIFQK
jgi:hypothetical protein